jgi:hypothetical protein
MLYNEWLEDEMSVRSVTQQIFDAFIEELSKDKSIDEKLVESLRELLESGNFEKEDIIKLLRNEDLNENPRA